VKAVWLWQLSHVRAFFATRLTAQVRRSRIADETTILNFRRMLEKHKLTGGILQAQ
jgi:hypothetical protein